MFVRDDDDGDEATDDGDEDEDGELLWLLGLLDVEPSSAVARGGSSVFRGNTMGCP